MEPQPSKDPPLFQFRPDKPYRCRPSLNKSIIVGSLLVDLDGTFLQFYSVSTQSLIHSIEVLQRTDQYGAKLEPLSDNIIVIFGVSKFIVFQIDTFKIVQQIEVNSFIQHCETRSGFIYTLTTEEDGEMKIINCWQIDAKTGELIKKFPALEFAVPEFQDCTDENIAATLLLSIDSLPKVYVYWKNTNQIIQIDPIKGISQRFLKAKSIIFISDIDQDCYAEITYNLISVYSKKQGKELAKLFNQGEKYRKVYASRIKDCLYSISDKGIKKWELKSNSQAQLLAESEKYPVERLFFTKNNEVVGINIQTKHMIIWENSNECKILTFPSEVVRRILKMSETQAFLLLEATASSEEEDEHHVNKYNKMQIYDFQKDIQIAKKAVLKFQYQIDVNSAVICSGDTVRFILNEDSPEGIKKYIFRWSPFIEDKKKQIKRREVVGAKDFDIIKIFSFDRILAVNKPKEQQSYNLFSKTSSFKSQILLYDFNAKNFGSYDMAHTVKDVQMSSDNQLYIVTPDKLCIYSIDTTMKNRLEKIQQLEMSAVFVKPVGSYLMVRKADSCLLYDRDFELVMKEEADEKETETKIMEVSDKKFIVKTEKKVVLWDIEQESTQEFQGIPSCSPLLCEFMNKNIIVSDKWIKAYPTKS